MSDLGPAVVKLVDIAKVGKPDWAVREAVGHVLQAFDPRDTKGAKYALKELGAAVKTAAPGRAQQVVLLAIGALVESGASPELAFPPVRDGLISMLKLSARFGDLCMEVTDTPLVSDALQMAGHLLEKKHPKEAAAWAQLPSRCLAAVACLSRSPKLRKQEREKGELVAACEPFYQLVEDVTFLSHVTRVLDPNQKLLVIHPETRRGWRFAFTDITTNLELYVLFLDMIVGDPSKGLLKAGKPNPRAVRALTDPDYEVKTPPEVNIPFHTVQWTGLLPDGTLRISAVDRHAHHWVWLDGVPLDVVPFQGERVILLAPPVMKRSEVVEPAFSALSPSVKLTGKLSQAEVDRLMAKMTRANAARLAKASKLEKQLTKRADEMMEYDAAMSVAQKAAQKTAHDAAKAKAAKKTSAKPKKAAKKKASPRR